MTDKEYKEKYPEFDKVLQGRTMTLKAPKEKRMNFHKELRDLINRHSMERVSNTPDFILASYIESCLETFAKTMKERDDHIYIPEEANGNSSSTL